MLDRSDPDVVTCTAFLKANGLPASRANLRVCLAALALSAAAGGHGDPLAAARRFFDRREELRGPRRLRSPSDPPMDLTEGGKPCR
jgi:hypothetical protein